MTHEEAARILDPETSREALVEYAGADVDARMDAVDRASRIAAEVLRSDLLARVEAAEAENTRLRAEVEHWKSAHHQAALNFQQENRECNKALSELEQVRAENAALRKMQPIQLDDTGAQALTLAAEVSELRKKLEAYEATGLEPEDLKKPFDEEVLLTMTARMMGITPDRLRELVEADHDGRCFITGRPYPVTGKAADDKITGWVKDGFYCHICKKRHERAIKKTVYLSKEAALKGEQDG